MKYILHLLQIGVTPVVILGCANGFNLSQTETRRQTINFAGRTVHTNAIYSTNEQSKDNVTLPVLTATGRGADLMVPMTIPVFGGMLVALITLFVVPVLYCFVAELQLKFSNKSNSVIKTEK
ncbi:MAG: efflux RND transporter permease subunit [Phycisphaerales bacterium]|jgi:hypothetical protein|nr:efflux RND transporter permease subunit [Phycisphaerales bacterium]